jgi:predicted metalloprotease
VKWTRGTQNDDVVDARGSRVSGGVKVGAGGAVGLLVLVIVSQVLGVDVTGLLGGGGGGSPTSTNHTNNPPPGPDPDAETVDFVKFVMKDIQDTFEGMYRAEGKSYRRAKLVLFTEAVDTGCGRSSSAIGPFYCPPDEKAYIDLSFCQLLKNQLGAPGDFAQAYVLAHEIGHHLQTLNGLEGTVQKLSRDKRSRNAASVRQELQADCFAGVWAHSAYARKLLEIGDLDEALRAASQIGDDRLQKDAGREVNAETFTHGTSQQRMKWFRRGYDTGQFSACDTFSQEP